MFKDGYLRTSSDPYTTDRLNYYLILVNQVMFI